MKSTIHFLAMLAVALAPASLASYSTAQQAKTPAAVRLIAPHRQATLPGLLQTWYRYWDKGYLITFGIDGTSDASPTQPSIVLYDQSGKIAREATVWFKDAYRVGINDVAVGRSGNLVVAGGTENQAGVIANFIASIGNDGQISQVIRTTPFLPIYVCVADDGTAWSYGIDRDEDGRRVDASPVLRQYDFEKGQLQAKLYKSDLGSASWAPARGRYPGEVSLRCSSHKVGLYNGAASQYVEVDALANKLKVFKIAPLPSPKEMRVTGFAVTDSGEVFVSLRSHFVETPRSGIFKLSFGPTGIGSWLPVVNSTGLHLHGGPVERLLGTDGTDLVYTRDLDGTAYWSKLSY